LTAPLIKTLEANWFSQARTGNIFVPIGRVAYAAVVTGAYFIPQTAAAGTSAAESSRTYTVYNRGPGGTGTVVVASRLHETTSGSLVNDTPWALTLSATTASLILASGDVLELGSEYTSSGTLDPGGKIVVTYSRS
jgi:hypothetical protein